MARASLKNVGRLLNQMSDDIPVETSFLSDLKRSLEMTDSKNRRLPSQTYKPSSMKCIRNMWYQRVGAAPDESTNGYCMIGICNSGSDIHERVQRAVLDMQSNNMDCEYVNVGHYVRTHDISGLDVVRCSDFTSGDSFETKLFYNPLCVSFLCDGIIRYKGRYYILEIKTESSFKWRNRTDVDPAHYAQGTAYSHILCIPNVIFLYVNRDVLDMKAYMFTPTEESKLELVHKIEECERYVQSGVCPPVPEDVTKKTCDYCAYKTTCGKEI